MSKINECKILITGGAGFIGYHLAFRLSQEPKNQLVLADNFTRGELDQELERLIERDNVQLISVDLTDGAAYEKLGSNYDEVYHLAAVIGVQNVMERPHQVLRVNAIGTWMLLEWFVLGGGKKLLFSSTSEAYAWTQQFHTLPIPTPEDVPLALTDLRNPRSSYAGSKVFSELAITQCCSVYKKPFAIVRYHNVYGPRMGYQHVIPQLYERSLKGQNPLIVYSADHQRAFCYVEDAVTATILAMRHQSTDGQTFNIGNEQEEVTIQELAQRILAQASIQVDLQPQVAAHDPIKRRCPDLSRARDLLGYQPQISLDRGLELTLAWYGDRLAARLGNKE
ncbi:NAD-dependent epimerase/dehydratase family protein [Moorena sp. SIO3A2]|uniref:NAD-dependent epimerase/dehydratase family protein n=1 Tax=Moorena sp. SIO3A2 TaxID=2607841 RepID=UPI0013BD0601|nr:NAD-dependent epimerase/dehydratase family protein [Moorena sp. SIO3A2]NER87927.1 NAD-dependent epimerase/dehydratase family protein [Moorena sp. SIO3A2]